MVESLIWDPFFCQEQRPLAALTTFKPIGTVSGCICSSGHPTSSAIHIILLRKSEDWSNPEPQCGVKAAAGVAVAGVMAVPAVAIGVLTLGIGVLTPGIGMKIPETGTMTGMLR